MSDTDMLYMASLQKKLDEVEAENAELRARISELEGKHLNECRQIAHYDDELSKAKELLAKVPKVLSNLCFAVSESGGCEFCPYGKTNPGGACDVKTLRKAIESLTGGETNEK